MEICRSFISLTERHVGRVLGCTVAIIGTCLFGLPVARLAPDLEAAGQRLPPGIAELARLSGFVGFIRGESRVSHMDSLWRQRIFVESVEPLKGDLGAGSANRYPYLAADYVAFTGYPTWFGEKGEYLVFLRRESVDGKVMWVTTAALAIEYGPDSDGSVVGLLSGGQDHPSIGRREVRGLLRRILAGDSAVFDDARLLHQRLSDVALSPAWLGERDPLTFEQRFEQVQVLAFKIRVGTPRTDVEKIFPQQDGGLGSAISARYYAGSEVMVEVPFNHENRVAGPLKVYRSHMHFD